MNIGGFTDQVFFDRLSVMLILILGLGIGTVLVETVLYWLFARVLKTKHALAYTLLSPAVIALAIFTVYPLLFNVQLAFSDLRIRTLACYAPVGSSNVACPLESPEVGQPVTVSVDKLTLRQAPGDDQPSVSDVSNGATLTVLATGKVAAAVSAGVAPTQTSGVDLGAPAPSSGHTTAPTPVAPAIAA